VSNPYESPTSPPEAGHAVHDEASVPIHLRLLAIVIWITFLPSVPFGLFVTFDLVKRPYEDVVGFDPTAWLFAGSAYLMAGLLPLGSALLGLGCWRRSSRLVKIGIVLLLVGFALMRALCAWAENW
jgi:hypothetical protein